MVTFYKNLYTLYSVDSYIMYIISILFMNGTQCDIHQIVNSAMNTILWGKCNPWTHALMS